MFSEVSSKQEREPSALAPAILSQVCHTLHFYTVFRPGMLLRFSGQSVLLLKQSNNVRGVNVTLKAD